MEAEYTTVFVINLSKLFRGYRSLKELLLEHAPWAWGENDRTLIAPSRFKEHFENEYQDLKIDESEDYGSWIVIRERIDKLVYADRKPRDGYQNDHYIDLEN